MRYQFATVVAVMGLLVAACGSDDEGSEATAAPEGTTAATEAAPAATEAAGSDATAAPEGTTGGGQASDSICVVSGSGEATGEPIKIGSIQGKTGPDDFSSSGQGAKAFFECVNANGGIDGRPVDYMIEDDQWTPEVAAQAATKLVNDEGVVALVGSSSFVECGVNEPLYEESGVVVVAGTGVPRECFFSKQISPTNSGPRISALGAAQYLAREKGATTMACISQSIPNTGTWVCQGLEDWGKTAGVEVRTILHDPASADFTAIVQDAMSTEPDAVILMEPAGLAAGFLKAAEEQDLKDATMWAGPTSLYLASFPETIGEYWWGSLTVQAELTTIDADTPDNQAWIATMDQYGEDSDPRDTFSQAGWLAAKIFTEAALSVGADNITRESMATAISAITNYQSDLMCTPWYFGPGDRHNANHGGRVMTINADGQFELVQDCQEVADPELEDVLALEQSEGLVG